MPLQTYYYAGSSHIRLFLRRLVHTFMRVFIVVVFFALVQQCCSPKRIHENRTRPMTHRYRIISFECSRERFRFFHTQTHKLTECRCVLLRTSHNSPQLFRTQFECSCSTFDIIITAHLWQSIRSIFCDAQFIVR